MSHHENWPQRQHVPADDEQPSGGAIFGLALAILIGAIGYLVGLHFGWWSL